MLAFAVLDLVSQSRDWLGRTSPKFTTLCRVGCKILIHRRLTCDPFALFVQLLIRFQLTQSIARVCE